MNNVIIFGGTTEGRRLCAMCAKHDIPALYCVATEDGARAVEAFNVHRGRLDALEMTALFTLHKPTLIIDATHPYAENVSRNIAAACRSVSIPLICIERKSVEEQGCIYFDHMDDILHWLRKESGNIFVTMGSSYAEAFTNLPEYRNRIWLRILPSLDSLRLCLHYGYSSKRLICMQGPFSEEINRAMFKTAEADILVTKDSGAFGGFLEKIRAAQSLGMRVAVLSKPNTPAGLTLDEAQKRLMELTP